MTPTERHAERAREIVRRLAGSIGGPRVTTLRTTLEIAISDALASVERETLERAAERADQHWRAIRDRSAYLDGQTFAARAIASAIRALSHSTDKGEPK
jgi:hypothetical protein